MSARTSALVALALCLTTPGLTGRQQVGVDHPTKLSFPPFTFVPPRATDYRVELPNGAVAYVAANRRFPLASIRVLVRGGSLQDPPDRVGLSRLHARFLSQAGTDEKDAREIRRFIEKSGGRFSVTADNVATTLDLSLHSDGMEEAVRVIARLLRQPVFDPEALARDRELTGRTVTGSLMPEIDVRTRFDRLLYRDHPLVRPPTPGLAARITAAELLDHHHRLFTPKNTVLAIAGDFDRDVVIGWLRGALTPWTGPESPALPAADVTSPPARRIVLVHRPGLKQAFGHVGHFGIRLTDPDYIAGQVMNWILTGGKVHEGIGAFSARLWYQLRTLRGISSMGYSEFWDTWFYPPPFVVYWKGREERTGEAVAVILSELERIRKEPVTPMELDTAKHFFLYGLPARFYSAEATVRTFQELEFNRAPLDYYERFQAGVARITAADVQRVARDRIHPEQLLMVILGDADRIQAYATAGGFPLDKLVPVEVVKPE